MSQQPTMQTRTQVEFGTEENRTFAALARAMGNVAWVLNLVGLAFLAYFGLLLYQAVTNEEGYTAVVVVGAAALVGLTIGFQTYWAARSFRRIVETQSRDVWHLMNALQTLRSMYAMLWWVLVGAVLLLVLAAILWVIRPAKDRSPRAGGPAAAARGA